LANVPIWFWTNMQIWHTLWPADIWMF